MPDLQEILKRNTLIREPGKPLSPEDEELAKVLEESQPQIFVVGSGGAGCNTIQRMMETGIQGAKIVAMNTDAQHLLRIRADKRILLGKKKTKGLGAGSNPEIGQAAAEESEAEIRELFKRADLVFITGGMGGGTGTGSAHVIARAAKESGALVIGVVTMPFTSEGKKRMANALVGLEKLRKAADCTITIPNDKLLYYVPDLPLNAAFKAADMVLTNSVKGIVEVVTKPGLVNVDFADVRTILQESGLAVIGLGEIEKSSVADRAMKAADKALTSPLLDIDVSQADRALVNITGGESMTLGEAESAVNSISERIHKDAHVIWGATLDPQMPNDSIRVLAVLTGIKEVQQMVTFKDAEATIDTLEFV
ncbi:MAG TPA: cell division protein FtsZ [Candidatus Norongarragalinales archaeon]|jgi:cell division protein FtsZ|nr:cell division protein FtsZ [Candidatus Norongarragalinales archaeon]